MEPIGIEEIMKTIPHRYPFLLIDRILELEKGERIVAAKNVTMNEPHFTGHYPGNPIMPGVLIIEAMAQAASFLGSKTFEDQPGQKIPLFAGIEKARFKRVVKPGDTLIIEIKKEKERGMIWWTSGTAKVEGKLACRAEIQAAFQVVE